MAKDLNDILLSTIEENKIKEKTPDKLPLNPTAEGWSGQEVRRFLAKSLIDNEGSFLAVFKKKMIEIKAQFEDVFGQGDGDIQGKIDSIIQNIDEVELTASSLATTVLNNYNSLNNLKVNRTLTILGIDLQDNITLSEFKTALGDATLFANGLMSALDKQNLAQTMLDIQSLFSDKADKTALAVTDQNIANLQNDKVNKTQTIMDLDFQDNITRTEVVNAIGEATQNLSGLMSITDKQRLDVLHTMLGVTADADNVVNTINEIMAIFATYPEGADILTAFNGKVDKVAGKQLSTNDLTDTLKDHYNTAYTHSQIKDKSNPHNTSFANITEKPTTRDGFGITDVYTKPETYTQQEINALFDNLSAVKGLKTTLLTPTELSNSNTISTDLLTNNGAYIVFTATDTSTGEIDSDTVPVSTIITGKKFVFFDNQEIVFTIGSTTSTFQTTEDITLKINLLYLDNESVQAIGVDFDGSLTNYLLTQTNVQEAIEKLDNELKTTQTALDNKVDKVSGKGLSANDFTNNDKNKLDGIEAGAEVNPYSKTQLDNMLNNKVDKVTGKGLSTEDYTSAEKTKLSGIQAGAEVNVQSNWNATSGDALILNKPIIPTNVSQLNNDSEYITGYTETDPIFTAWNKSTGISITKSQVSDLIEATQKLSGLMSSTDKQRLDVLHALLEEDAANAVVDSINEVLEIFNNYPEGADLVTALSGKVDKVSGKGLSTNDFTTTEKNKLSGIATNATANSGTVTNVSAGTTQISGLTLSVANGTTTPTITTSISNAANFRTAIGAGTGTSNLTIGTGASNAKAGNYQPTWAQVSGKPTFATVATSGSYNDLSNKPSIPSAQVQSNWDATTGMGVILNKPALKTVATSGSYNDLSNRPSIPAAQVAVNWNSTSGITAIINKPNLATVATSGNYNDLSNKPSIPSTYELTKPKIDTALKGAGLTSVQLGTNASAEGANATAIGIQAKAKGTSSTAVGQSAKAEGNYSTALGYGASAEETSSTALGSSASATGSDSTAVGDGAKAVGIRSTALGVSARTGDSIDTMRLGNTTLSKLEAKVQLTVTSDIRDKADIVEIPKALDFIKDLNPITYVSNDRDHYISEEQKETDTYRGYLMVEDYDKQSHSQGTKKGSRRRVGLSAQEVRDKLIEHYGSDNYANVVNDNFVEFKERELDIPEGLENKLTMSYETMVPFLIKAIQEQQEQIEELKKKIKVEEF